MGNDKEDGRRQKGMGIPSTVFEEEPAVSNRDKAEIMTKSFTKVHSLENVSGEGKEH